jgi:predicted DNA-binding transcriptional regulator AlpA
MMEPRMDALRAAALAMDPYLGTADLAARLGKSTETLRNWRSENRGPKWCWLGGRIAYKLSDVATWLDDCEKGRAT